jgi:AcrR family transcriptional regulator
LFDNEGERMAGKTPDRRVQRTQQLLQTALMALIQEQGYEALTVQDIIDRANVGRATFYAHFDSKEDLLVSRLDGLRASLQAQQRNAKVLTSRSEDRMFAYSREMFVHVDEHRSVFRSMVGKRSGATIQHLFHKMLVDLVREDVKAMAPPKATGGMPHEAVAQLIAGGLFGLILWWVDGPARLSIEEVDALFRRLAMPALKAMG